LLLVRARAADPATCEKGALGEAAVSDGMASIDSGTLESWELAASYLYRAVALRELRKLREAMAVLKKPWFLEALILLRWVPTCN
jgi:hypothetical protein